MRRGIIWAMCMLIFLSQIFYLPEVSDASNEPYQIFLNGERLNIQPVVKGDVVYLPVQAIASKLQLSVEWNPQLNVVKINDRIAEATPLIREGIIFLPAESIAQSINAMVKWDGKKRRLQIDVSPDRIPSSNTVSNTPIKVNPVIPVPKTPTEGSVSPIPGMTPPSNQNNPSEQSSNLPQSGIDSYPYPSTSAYPGSSAPPANPNSTVPDNVYRKKSALSTGGIPTESGYYTYPQTTASESLRNTMPDSEPFVQPLNAPPQMPDGLQLPPQGPEYNTDSIKNPSVPAEMYSTPTYPHVGVFTPKKVQNGIFSVTVTNMEELQVIKNFYRPHTGSKYVVVYVTQQNISDKVQVYTGKFSLVDGENKIYEYQEGLSNFWLVILRPGSLNFGYLVFEIPDGAVPARLVLHALNQDPMAVGLE